MSKKPKHIYCQAVYCKNNSKAASRHKGFVLCKLTEIHLQGCSPDADNVFVCADFVEKENNDE